MLEQLFGSKSRVKILRVFFNNPEESFFVRELTRLIRTHLNSVRRELKNLYKLGILKMKKVKDKKYYYLNKDYFLYPELKALLLKADLLLEKDLIKKIKRLGKIYYLILTGIFVGLKDMPTDILIVGRLNRRKLRNLIKRFEKELNREINYTLMSLPEFKYRKDITDKFLYHILENKRVEVINEIEGL